ncbi:hypothetical protein [Nonomuraea insulae]|uniref:Integral membrane protein n=1 Tax=Nonomuraea insulae TaxID=1616787 RepID=A0ABW1CDM8_9ACTN
MVGLGTIGLASQWGHAVLGTVAGIAWFAAVVSLIIVLYSSARLTGMGG